MENSANCKPYNEIICNKKISLATVYARRQSGGKIEQVICLFEIIIIVKEKVFNASVLIKLKI
jgi:DNA invertase Pin-like site-specific DNA recombinase